MFCIYYRKYLRHSRTPSHTLKDVFCSAIRTSSFAPSTPYFVIIETRKVNVQPNIRHKITTHRKPLTLSFYRLCCHKYRASDKAQLSLIRAFQWLEDRTLPWSPPVASSSKNAVLTILWIEVKYALRGLSVIAEIFVIFEPVLFISKLYNTNSQFSSVSSRRTKSNSL